VTFLHIGIPPYPASRSNATSTRVLGIEIDPQSISYATHNATINGIPNASFHAGASEHIFESAILELEGKADRTTLIVDPPRKGCDEAFLGQVVAFRPKVVVYVSCNVHTSA
jgi:tRNA (uracil-5-)-methyltransferase